MTECQIKKKSEFPKGLAFLWGRTSKKKHPVWFVTLVIVWRIVYNDLTMDAAPDNLDKSFAAYWHQQYLEI